MIGMKCPRESHCCLSHITAGWSPAPFSTGWTWWLREGRGPAQASQQDGPGPTRGTPAPGRAPQCYWGGDGPAKQNTNMSMGQSRVRSQEVHALATQPFGKLPNQPTRFHRERPGRGRGGLDLLPSTPALTNMERAPKGWATCLLPPCGPLCPGCQAVSLPGTCPESSACGDWPSLPGSQALSN